jgi:hypothetical protein
MTPSVSATQFMSSAQSMGTYPFIFSNGMTSSSSISIPPGTFLMGMPCYSTQSMPLASNPFSFGMSNMTSYMSSSFPTPNVDASFGSGGTSPPCNPFPFGGGHIPQSFPMMGGWNPPSSGPNPSYNFQGWNGHMGGVSTSYISFVYPSSTMPFPECFFYGKSSSNL